MNRQEILDRAKPILFNAGMVREVLKGRKTVTRRVMKPQPMFYTGRKYIFADDVCPKKWIDCDNIIETYKYQPGDILYVRETWSEWTGGYLYRAWPEGIAQPGAFPGERWRPSIHMPKEAARIFLRVTDVRVERLQAITEEQARTEGVGDPYHYQPPEWYDHHGLVNNYLRDAFAGLWNSTIKKSDIDRYGWDANPFVWVIKFEMVEVE